MSSDQKKESGVGQKWSERGAVNEAAIEAQEVKTQLITLIPIGLFASSSFT